MADDTIENGTNTPLNVETGTIPDVVGAMFDWFQPMVFERTTKETVGFEVVETQVPINFQGMIQPYSERQLFLKPEGQRAWTWFLLHADPVLSLNVDEVINYVGVQTRVMARKDFSIYGYIEYQLVQDWSGSGPSPEPIVATFPVSSDTIENGKDIPLDIETGTIPNLYEGLVDWFQPIVFERIEKQTVGFEVKEVATTINFEGVIQPFSERQLVLMPEGQRAWTWITLHADPVLFLRVDDIIRYLGINYRVMGRRNYFDYGYVEYRLVQDWTDTGILEHGKLTFSLLPYGLTMPGVA